MTRTLALQWTLVALVMLACLLMPRAGSAVLLLPLQGRAAALSAPVFRKEGMVVLGHGRIGGSVLILPRGTVPVWRLLANGIVPLAVPPMLCAAATAP